MPFDPKQFADLAAAISDPASNPSEAHIRTACGRAYYAAFLAARSRLRGIGHKIPNTGQAHDLVIRTLRSARRNPTLSGLGQQLGSMIDDRHDADYKLSGPYRSPMAFGSALGVLRALGAVRWIEDLSKVTDAVLLKSCPP